MSKDEYGELLILDQHVEKKRNELETDKSELIERYLSNQDKNISDLYLIPKTKRYIYDYNFKQFLSLDF